MLDDELDAAHEGESDSDAGGDDVLIGRNRA